MNDKYRFSCLVCRVEDPSMQMCKLDSEEIRNSFETCTSINLRSSDDPLPLQLCVDCQTTFEKWKEFRTKAQESHRQFRNEFYLDRALADCLWMDLDKAEQMKEPENQPLSQDVREKTRPVLDGLDWDEENSITLFLEDSDSDSETFTRDSDSSAADDEDVDGNYQPPDDNQDSSDDDDQKVLSQRTRSSEGSLKRKREEENNRYLCDQCTRTFTRIGHLEIHQRTHFTEEDIEERFCCNRCEKNFATQSNLNKHKRTHSKKNRDSFSCKHCEKSFAQQDYLIIHERIHTGVKPFKCDHKNCGKAFSRITYLNGHKRTHSGERPFKCDKCDQTFTQKTHLTTHEKVHKPRATRMNIRRSNKVENQIGQHHKEVELNNRILRQRLEQCSSCGGLDNQGQGKKTNILKRKTKENKCKKVQETPLSKICIKCMLLLISGDATKDNLFL